MEEFHKGWIPIKILSPGEPGSKQATAWRTLVASPEDEEAISVIIDRLRSAISGTVIPYLSLPLDTPPEDAIDIFIETNRSSVRLSPYDLAVAQMEADTSESLTEKIEELVQAVPAINDLENNVGDLVLKVQCLLEGKKPTYGNYAGIDFQKLNDGWQKITDGIKWTTETLGDLNIWTSQRLPTAVPLRVLPPLHGFIPRSGPGHANAMRLVKKYLWWSFLTSRYERQANDRLKEDFDALVGVLQRKHSQSDVPAFQHERPIEDDIKSAGWPTAGGILSRAILVVCSLQGANDIASNRRLRKGRKVEHHHIFPKAVLTETNREPNLALNCMLLESFTNKEWAKKWPGDYLMEMVDASKYEDPEEEVVKRLNTHLLPAKNLIAIKATPEAALESLYEEFINDRAQLVMKRIDGLLAEGN